MVNLKEKYRDKDIHWLTNKFMTLSYNMFWYEQYYEGHSESIDGEIQAILDVMNCREIDDKIFVYKSINSVMKRCESVPSDHRIYKDMFDLMYKTIF